MIVKFLKFLSLLLIIAVLHVFINVGEMETYFHAENCKEDPACGENCPVCSQRPFNIHTGQVLLSLKGKFVYFVIEQALFPRGNA